MPVSRVPSPKSRVEFRVASFELRVIALARCGVSFAVVLLLLTASSFAAELKVKVVDPQSAVVAGARVTVYPRDSSTAVAVRTTSAEGTCAFSGLSATAYRVEVLAPGFAPAKTRAAVAQAAEITVKLALPSAAETVVVSAERTPLPSQDTGSDTSSLGPDALTSTQPVSAVDTLRFLPGAIVSASGRRGGLSSLFVRGGDSRYNKVIVDGVAVNDPGGTFDFGVMPMYQVDRLEFVRGAESTLYGSDAMTSVHSDLDCDGNDAHAGGALRRGRRNVRHGARLRVGGGRARTI